MKREGRVSVPTLPKEGIHPLARQWYNSLRRSGQSEFFEPSDWQGAQFLALKLSGHLAADGFAVRLLFLADQLDNGAVVADIAKDLREMSLNTPRGSAAEFAAIWSAMESLLTTESARRRARLEIDRAPPEADDRPTALDEYRQMVGG